jgi:hypothetical protein
MASVTSGAPLSHVLDGIRLVPNLNRMPLNGLEPKYGEIPHFNEKIVNVLISSYVSNQRNNKRIGAVECPAPCAWVEILPTEAVSSELIATGRFWLI